MVCNSKTAFCIHGEIFVKVLFQLAKTAAPQQWDRIFKLKSTFVVEEPGERKITMDPHVYIYKLYKNIVIKKFETATPKQSRTTASRSEFFENFGLNLAEKTWISKLRGIMIPEEKKTFDIRLPLFTAAILFNIFRTVNF